MKVDQADDRSANEPQGARRKSSAWLFWLIPLTLWPAVAILLALGLIYGPMGHDNNASSGPEPFAIGEPIALGGYSLTVDSLEFLSLAPDPALNDASQAPGDDLFVVVKYTLANSVGSTLTNFKSPEIALKDGFDIFHDEDLAQTADYDARSRTPEALSPAPPPPGGVIERAAVFRVKRLDFDPADWLIEIVDHDEVSMASVRKPAARLAPIVRPGDACVETAPMIRKGFQTERAYPRDALEARIEGRITIQYAVGPTGEVDAFKVLQAEPAGQFENAVETELRRMRWYPASRPRPGAKQSCSGLARLSRNNQS